MFERGAFEYSLVIEAGAFKATFVRHPEKGSPEQVSLPDRNPYKQELRLFADCIAGKADPALLPERAREALRCRSLPSNRCASIAAESIRDLFAETQAMQANEGRWGSHAPRSSPRKILKHHGTHSVASMIRASSLYRDSDACSVLRTRDRGKVARVNRAAGPSHVRASRVSPRGRALGERRVAS